MAANNSNRPPRKRARKSTSASSARPRKRAASKRARPRRAAAKQRPPAVHFLLWLFFFPFILLHRWSQSWHPVLKWPSRVIGHSGIALCMLGFIVAISYYVRALNYDIDEVAEMPARSVVYANDGKTELGKIHGTNRNVVSLEGVPEHFQHALISREDARFNNHIGVDLRGVGRIIWRRITTGRQEGASTLTMQLARNTFPLGGKTLDRKLLEIAVSLRIEAAYDKSEIMEHYINRIFWGHSIHGIESAALTYFEKSAKDLTLGESAMLAGIIRGPNKFSPFRSLKRAKQERDTTLQRMLHYGYITQAELDVARNEEILLRPPHRRSLHASYAIDAIDRELNRILEDHNIDYGGLQIFTTIDANLQQDAERAVDRHLRSIERLQGYRHQTRSTYSNQEKAQRRDPRYMQGAVVCIQNTTGAVLSVVGGRNADESAYNRALHAKRQVGSLFKPFVYLSAFSQGLQPGAYIKDGRIRPGEITGAPSSWAPANSNGKYLQYVTASQALEQSRNTSSIRVGDYAGLDRVASLAQKVGFQRAIPKTPASFLGAFEATPWEVASAYTIFPNGGVRYRPYLIDRILDREGNVLYPGSGKLPYVTSTPGATWSVANTLSKVVDKGTARGLRSKHQFSAPAGGKTGTTDNYRDAWFAGYTSTVTCAVWVGMDNNERTISAGYGSRLALPIWAEVIKSSINEGYSAGSLKPKFPFESATLCRLSCQHATSGCRSAGTSYRAQVPADENPNNTCDIHPQRAVIVE